MRHYKQTRKFNRPAVQRKAMINNMARSLILHEQILTTEAKAKDVRPVVERLITYGKRGQLADIRRLTARVGEKARRKTIDDLAVRYQERAGGYTRIVKVPPRKSDAARMAYIELV